MAPQKRKKKAATTAARPLCGTCGKRIHVPTGWSVGPAVRKHYWRHHPEAMRTAR